MMSRITPFDIPSQSQMILSSLLREEKEQKIIRYTGLEKGALLKDYAYLKDSQSIIFEHAAVAKYMYEMVKTAIGPFGMDKMVSKDLGAAPPTRHVFVTNDIFEFLNLLEFKHPVSKLLVNMAKAVDSEVGDGVATAVILGCSLVIHGCELVRMGLHPTTIVEGYETALKICLHHLEKIATPIKFEDISVLEAVALSAIRNKSLQNIEPIVARAAVRVYQSLRQISNNYQDMSMVKFERTIGSSLEVSLIDGVILRNDVIHNEMPKRVVNGRVALISKPIVTRDFNKPIRYDEIVFEFDDPSAYRRYSGYREKVLVEAANCIVASGANVLFLCKGIDEIAINILRKNNILAVRRIVPEDMERLAAATGGTIVATPELLGSEHLGKARLVEERKIGDSKWVIVEGCMTRGPRSILITAPYDEYARDAEHLILNCLKTLGSLEKDPRILPGGGIALLDAALTVRDEACHIGSKSSLAMMRFAHALEEIHGAIVENGGYEPLEVVAEVRRVHLKGVADFGFDVCEGEYKRFIEARIIDPLPMVKQALISAVAFAELVLKIDGVFYIPRTMRELMMKRKAEMRRKGKRPEDWIEEKQH
jgi:chaperonin GroEL (HSP60 family)